MKKNDFVEFCLAWCGKACQSAATEKNTIFSVVGQGNQKY